MALQLLGGLGLFFYGMNRLTNALQELAAGKLESLLRAFTRTTVRAAFFGVALTVALQSGAASTVMIVEFVNAGFLTLSQGLNVALSSALGSYILLQIISFPIHSAAMAAVFIGALAWHFIGTPRAKRFGQAFLGFGCIFIGIAYMNGSFAPLKEVPAVLSVLERLGAVPPLGILAGCVLAALLQGSSAFLAVVISLAAQGLVTTEAALALVLGAHIGGTLTPLLASLGADRADAKRLALANTFYRVAAAVLLAPFTAPLAVLIARLSFTRAGEVAVAYLLSTLFMVLVFLPLNRFAAAVLRRVVPEPARPGGERRLRYISRSSLPAPLIAANQAFRETRWLGRHIFENMFELIPRAMSSADEKWSLAIDNCWEDVEWHYMEIMRFLPELFNAAVTKGEMAETSRAQKFAHEWREVARCLWPFARQTRQVREFETLGPREWQYFEDIYTAVSSLYMKTLQILAGSATAAEAVETEYQRLLALAEEGRETLIFGEGGGYTPTVNFILGSGNALCGAAARLRAIARAY
ncbi:MAG: Na/Pi symporter [Gracilibacteraceae bacterium]|jgi:phosphate:Na+ symporter|nr:Na/Pi symporter [Gracilibacteraceae bacterium]